jgi:dolichol kinase
MMMKLLEEPFYQNIAASVATIIYVKVVIGTCDILVSQKVLAPRISRKSVHLAAGSWIIFWPLFTTQHWTWRLNIIVPAVYTIQLFVKGFIIRDPNDVDVQTMTRAGDPKELLNGPIFFTMLMSIVGLYLFRQKMGVVIMSCLGFGDGIAPLAGYYFPFGYYRTWPFGPNDRKTLSGSISFVIASIIGYHLMKFVILGDIDGSDDFNMMLQVASLAAITEGLCGPYDNPCIALSAALAYYYLST